MAGFRVLILLMVSVLYIQKARASMDEPLPAFQNWYVSDYEQNTFLSVLQNKTVDPLRLLLAGAAEMDDQKEEQLRSDLFAFVHKMKQKQEKFASDKVFLQKLFYKVHRKYLKEYKPYQNFNSLLNNGAYGCLSGTALYALILDDLDFSYRIFETDYHIFLMVETTEGEEILIESTDPLNGFLTEKKQIKDRIAAIKQDVLGTQQREQKPYHDLKLEIFREINLKQLAGLQYFNLAAHHYNNLRFKRAEAAIAKGRILYQAERFDKFASLLATLK